MMADHRRDIAILNAHRIRDRQEWDQRERRYLNQIEELERKLKAARDELAEARQTIVTLDRQIRFSQRGIP